MSVVITMDKELENFITEKINIEQFEDLIEKTSTVAWNGLVKRKKIEKWMSNFTGECLGNAEVEQKLALWLLLNFTYYTEKDVKKLCREAYFQFLREELRNSEFETKLDRNEKVKLILEDTLFVPLGNPSESGARILYDFRTENKLGKALFNEKRKKCRCLVLIDDVTISGQQAMDYLKKSDIEADKVYLIVFMATPEAIEAIEAENNLKIIYSILLDSRSSCFSDDSFVFQGEQEEKIKAMARTMCEYYGNKIMSAFSDVYMNGYSLGFDKGQQMFGFYYNTPDNTMPIFWCDENWKNIFMRYPKIYGKGSVEIDNGEFV